MHRSPLPRFAVVSVKIPQRSHAQRRSVAVVLYYKNVRAAAVPSAQYVVCQKPSHERARVKQIVYRLPAIQSVLKVVERILNVSIRVSINLRPIRILKSVSHRIRQVVSVQRAVGSVPPVRVTLHNVAAGRHVAARRPLLHRLAEQIQATVAPVEHKVHIAARRFPAQATQAAHLWPDDALKVPRSQLVEQGPMLVVKHTAAPLQQIALSLQLHLVRRIFVVSTGIATHTQRYARSINPIRATVVKHRVGKRHHHAPRHSGAVSNTHTRTPLWCRHKVTRRQGAVRSSDRQHRNVKRRQHGHRVGSRLRASSHNGQGSNPHSHQAHKLFEMPHHILCYNSVNVSSPPQCAAPHHYALSSARCKPRAQTFG